MRNAPSILLVVALAAPTFAEEFDVLFDQPQLDRWMYPFNSSAGARATMSVFGSDREVPTQFDARDGQILLAFDTDLVIPPGGTAAGYRVTSAEVTMQVQNNLVFRYDPTPDAWTTFLPASDTRRTVDADEGQPVELFGVGFRGGYSAATFAEDTAFTGSVQVFVQGQVNHFFVAGPLAGDQSRVGFAGSSGTHGKSEVVGPDRIHHALLVGGPCLNDVAVDAVHNDQVALAHSLQNRGFVVEHNALHLGQGQYVKLANVPKDQVELFFKNTNVFRGSVEFYQVAASHDA
jgi:hypothetical protein